MNSLNDQLSSRERALILRRIGHRNINRDSGKVNNIKNLAYEDTNPSLSVDLDTGAVNDYGSGYTGDIIDYVREVTGKDFKTTVGFLEGVIGRDLQDRTPTNQLLDKPREKKKKKRKKPEPFWTEPRVAGLSKCQKVLDKKGIVDSMDFIMKYDGIKKSTLGKYGCGLYGFKDYEFGNSGKEYNRKPFYCFPYHSGCMLYRRGPDGKNVKHVKGSKAAHSFFGIGSRPNESNITFLMKSPREAMNFSQYATDWNVIGLATGENLKELSLIQEEQLDKIIIPGDSIIYVCTDCDKPEAYENALMLSQAIAKYVKEKASVRMINLWKHSDGKFKDFTDIAQEAMEKGCYINHAQDHVSLYDESESILYKAIEQAEEIVL